MNTNQVFAQLTEEFNAHKLSQTTHRNVPNRRTLIRVFHCLRAVMFPGYLGERLPGDAHEQRLHKALEELQAQIYRAYRHENMVKAEAREKASEVTQTFLERLPTIQQKLFLDLQAGLSGDPAARSREEVLLAYPGFQAISMHRMIHELFVEGVPLIPRLMSEYMHSVTGIDIHPGATIGHSFFIDHGTGVVIGETAVIGDGVKIYQGVTIGALSLRKADLLRYTKRHPTIGNGVVIYAGATILGGNTVIGDRCTIGGNVFLVESVPEDTRVSLCVPKNQFQRKRTHE